MAGNDYWEESKEYSHDNYGSSTYTKKDDGTSGWDEYLKIKDTIITAGKEYGNAFGSNKTVEDIFKQLDKQGISLDELANKISFGSVRSSVGFGGGVLNLESTGRDIFAPRSVERMTDAQIDYAVKKFGFKAEKVEYTYETGNGRSGWKTHQAYYYTLVAPDGTKLEGSRATTIFGSVFGGGNPTMESFLKNIDKREFRQFAGEFLQIDPIFGESKGDTWKQAAGAVLGFAAVVAGGVTGQAWLVDIGVSLLVTSVAIPAIVSMFVGVGIVREKDAAIFSTILNLAFIYYSWKNGGYTGSAESASLKDALIQQGVSEATATAIQNAVTQAKDLIDGFTKFVGASPLQIYSFYETISGIIETNHNLEMEYRMAQARFEAWKTNYEKQQQETSRRDQEIADFVSGAYYRKMAGQPLFNVNLAGHGRYIATDVQRPSWGLDTKPAYNVEPEVAKLMWYDKQFDMAGGSSFMAIQLDMPKFV